MKKILLFFVLTSFITFSQTKTSGNTKADISVLTNLLRNNNGQVDENILLQYPVYKLNGGYYLSVLGKTSKVFDQTILTKNGILFGSSINNIVSLKFPIEKLDLLLTFSEIEYLEIASKVKPDLDKALKDTKVDSVHHGINLPQGFTGKNVLIGITDWGFDYTHPMFYDTLLNESRILAAWDQYKIAGPAPSGYAYGTEYDTPLELQTAQADTANIYGYATHGSHVAGISGGGGAGTVYRGVGFDSQYLFTTFLVDNASVLDAYSWMYQKSLSENKRLVINQSWGLHHIGTLDGNSLLSQAIDSYSDLGVVFCSSAGNNGGTNFHIKKVFANDTIKTRISFNPYSGYPTMWGQSISMWGEVGHNFSASIGLLNSSNIQQNESPWYSTLTTNSYVDTFLVVGTDTIFYNISADNIHPLNDRSQMRLRVKCTNTNLRIVLRSTANTGTVHYWNVVELTNDVGNWGLPFSTLGTGYVAGDKEYGISEPACTKSVISVAAHSSEYKNGAGTSFGGAIASFSSYGPTLDERIKPDISAPGVDIASSISSFTDNSYTLLSTVSFNGNTYPFSKFSGTSMSSPMVTGIVTLILEANPLLTPQEVKDIIKITARTDNFTGVIPNNGSVRWGAGKINAYKCVQLARSTESIESIEKEVSILLFPNPSNDKLNLIYPTISKIEKVELVSVDGKISDLTLEIDDTINISSLKDGMYFIKIEMNNQSIQIPFVKE
jgi:minor extracellular serine protease Vpr